MRVLRKCHFPRTDPFTDPFTSFYVNKKLFPMLCIWLCIYSVRGQSALLYQQDWGSTNGGTNTTTLASVGWNQILPPSGYQGIYQQGSHYGSPYDVNSEALLPANSLYFGGNSGLGMFYTTNGAGSGAFGDSGFKSINPALYTNLQFSVETQWSWQGSNMVCWFAVKVGGAWYVATNQPLTTSVLGNFPGFSAATMTYNPAATNWNVLTINPTPVVGAQAASNLSGTINGIGIVASTANSASWDFNLVQIASISNVAPSLMGPASIYQEDWGTINGGTRVSALASVGWAAVSPTGSGSSVWNYNSPNVCYYGINTAGLAMIYTTNGAGAGVYGDSAFTAINPSFYGPLQFSITAGSGGAGGSSNTMVSCFAVQAGGVWYVSTNSPLTLNQANPMTMTFNPAATNWNLLTVGANSLTIGGQAANALSGAINGLGLVGWGTGNNYWEGWNINLLQIIASPPTNPLLSSAVYPGPLSAAATNSRAITLNWGASPAVHLQSTTNLALPASWTDVPNTTGANAFTFTNTRPQTYYFRLCGLPQVLLSQANSNFAANGGPAANPSGWTTAGSGNSSAVIGGDGAGANNFCLQQSNSAPYQVGASALIAGLPNGFYSLTAQVKNSGGQNWCYISGNDKLTSLPVSPDWTNTIVRGINVTNGQCLVSICSSDNGGDWCRVSSLQLINDGIPYNFLKGGDISELTYVEQGGGVFYETNGVQEDCLQILQNHGWNVVRLRLYINPGPNPGNPNQPPLPAGIETATNILDLSRRAKSHGMKVVLNFYYSDGWNQYVPSIWTNLTFVQLTNAEYQYTTNFMGEMAGQGTPPDYVMLGDEITGGGPLGPYGSYTNFPGEAAILTAGYHGVKDICPSSQVILSLGGVQPQWFINSLTPYNVPFDVIGWDYYPFWNQITCEQARDQVNSWCSSYNKPTFCTETGYNWATNTCTGGGGQLANNGPEPFPSTPQGQKKFLLNCFNALKCITNGLCIGDLYWDPVFIGVPGEGWDLGGGNVVDNTTLFDCSGHALPALDAFQFNN